MYKVNVTIEKDEHGYFAYCPALEGCQTQGNTFEEALSNTKEAIAEEALNINKAKEYYNTLKKN